MSPLLRCTYGASSAPPSMAARKSRGSRPNARAPATAWATPAVTMKTHEFADQLHPAARAGRPQPQRLGTDGIEHRCDPFPHLLRPGGEHDQRALLGRLLRP